MMGLLTRALRLCKADLHGVMDQIENRELLLKQHLRDMQAALMRNEAELSRICRARDQARQECEKADMAIDGYFEKTLGIKDSDVDLKKYKAWLMLYEKADSDE